MNLGSYYRISLYVNGDFIGSFHHVQLTEITLYEHDPSLYDIKSIHVYDDRSLDVSLFTLPVKDYYIQKNDNAIGGHKLCITI